MSIFSKIGKVLKKVALPVLGIGGALLGAPSIASSIGGLFSSKQAGGGEGGGATTNPVRSGEVDSRPLGTPPTAQSTNWGQLVNAAAPVVSGALGYLGQKQTNAANAQQAQAQMDFQEQQSSTSYQRGTADMKAAGLNPMLAYSQGGASSGSGGQAVMGNEVGQGANSAWSSARTLLELSQAEQAIQQTAAQTNLIQEQAKKTSSERYVQDILPFLYQQQTRHTSNQADKAGIESTISAIQETIARETMSDQIKSVSTANQARQADTALTRARIPEAKARGDAASNILPFISEGGKTISSARDWAGSHLGGYAADAVDTIKSIPELLKNYGKK
ncbi:MAG: DNA pilot protein [Microvirus sp.]|nr:MAG: DNA pilot protein [Microvirus sp.]